MRVYLAGGINGLSDGDATDWREEAKRLLPREIGVLDPMSRDYRGREDENVAEIVRGDLDDIAKSNAVIAYCPRPSWGTAMEIHHVATMGRDVRVRTARGPVTVGWRKLVAVVPAGVPVSPWLRHHSDAVVETLEAAVAQVVEWLGAS
jgi:hypothetical protein